jgi:hypothetical protein
MSILLIGIFLVISCEVEQNSNPLVHVLETSGESAIRSVMDELDRYEVQILFSQIRRTNNGIHFIDHSFQLEDSVYFYPASTVKFPIAVLALEKVSRNDNFTLNTRFYVEGDTLETTVANEVIKIFAVSDNQANNRLFEFMGQDDINDRLASKGIGPVRIAHRLSTDNADDVTTLPLIVYLNDSTTTQLGPTVNSSILSLDLEKTAKGKGYMEEEVLVREPFDFSHKNYYPIRTQQEMMKRIVFPKNYSAKESFRLGQEERQLLLDAMSSPPRKWGYDELEYYDSYGKFFIYGDTESQIPESVRIYNKVGYAYGTLTDCAYVHDLEKNIEFIISATILVNSDEVFNDDQYEYETIGIPFLAALGRELYNYELQHN